MSSNTLWTCDNCGAQATEGNTTDWLHTQYLEAEGADWAHIDLCSPDCVAAAQAKVASGEWFRLVE